MKPALFFLSMLCSTAFFAQTEPRLTNDNKANTKVVYSDYLDLAKEVEKYRQDRLVSLTDFQKMAAESNTIILDTRSKEMYDAKHLKGAVHLNFSDFNEGTLRALIPSAETRILIYCNNNFAGDEEFFPSKMARPMDPFEVPRMLALNIPTFINLYGYGYKNIYELADLVYIASGSDHLLFEGTAVQQPEITE